MRLTLRQVEKKIFEREQDGSESPLDEARLYAKAWKSAKTKKEQDRVFDSMRKNGGRWSLFTRSTMYFNVFENLVGRGFNNLWK